MAAAEEFWFELYRESNVEKKYRQESPNRFGQLSGGVAEPKRIVTPPPSFYQAARFLTGCYNVETWEI
jgi:hypothetical protein